MSSVRDRLDRAAEGFAPTRDWHEGAIERARRRQRRRRIGSAVVALVLFAGSFALVRVALTPSSGRSPTAAPACSRAWTRSSVVSADGGLTAISGTGPNDVWAVGPNDLSHPGSQTIIEHWDGSAWHRVPSPNAATGPSAVNELNGAAAIAPD